MNQASADSYYMNVALLTSKLSYAKRRQVGAVLVKDDSIISMGFNGTPSKFENICENIECTCKWTQGCAITATPIEDSISFEHCNDCSYAKLSTKPEVLHAESNALMKCARYGRPTVGATLYITDSPCIECAKLIIQAGISRVVYLRDYRSMQGVDLIKKANIEIMQLKDFVSNAYSDFKPL